MNRKNNKDTRAKIGVFGGSGFYSLLKKKRTVRAFTPYGEPSDKIMIGEMGGKLVAFLPRHGADHRYPPHKIPYRANLWAFKQLGVEYLISPFAAGSLRAEIRPGDFVVVDDIVDRTKKRIDSFFDGPRVAHFAFDKPYCKDLRRLAIEVIGGAGVRVHVDGTVVVVEGPRFSTRAESKFYANQGWGVINMTQAPEVMLAKEMEMCVVGIALITDYDVGLEGDPNIKPVTSDQVARVFAKNNERVKEVITKIVDRIDINKIRICECGRSGEGAFLS